jgi:hypothetical protein
VTGFHTLELFGPARGYRCFPFEQSETRPHLRVARSLFDISGTHLFFLNVSMQPPTLTAQWVEQ